MAASNLLSKSLFRPVMVSSAADAAAPTFSLSSFEEDEEWCVELDPSFPLRGDGFHSDVMFVPFSSNQSPFITSSRGLSGPSSHVAWVACETDEALNIRLEMPGLSNEDLEVFVLDNIVGIKVYAKKGSNEEVQEVDSGKFECKLDLTDKFFNIKEVKAEMKNGVLSLTVPKVKDEANADGIDVNVADGTDVHVPDGIDVNVVDDTDVNAEED